MSLGFLDVHNEGYNIIFNFFYKYILAVLLFSILCLSDADAGNKYLTKDDALKCVTNDLYYKIYWYGNEWVGLPSDLKIPVVIKKENKDILIYFDITSIVYPPKYGFKLYSSNNVYYIVHDNAGTCDIVKSGVSETPAIVKNNDYLVDAKELIKLREDAKDRGALLSYDLLAMFKDAEYKTVLLLDSMWEPTYNADDLIKRRKIKQIENELKAYFNDINDKKNRPKKLKLTIANFNNNWPFTFAIVRAIYGKSESEENLFIKLQFASAKKSFLLSGNSIYKYREKELISRILDFNRVKAEILHKIQQHSIQKEYAQ